MKIILTGSTGDIGSHGLQSALAHPAITSIIALSRRQLPITHPKLHVVILSDFLIYSQDTLEAWKGAEACIWCLGITRREEIVAHEPGEKKPGFFPALLEHWARVIAVDDLAAKMLDTAINGHTTQTIDVDVLRHGGKRMKKERQLIEERGNRA
ncbi:MAG: hypothetical protein Q9182_006297 [Xanthomendoza sp. 2 TL-2023]